MSDRVVETLLGILASDEVAKVPGLGLFGRQRLEGVTATNPRTGRLIRAEPRVIVAFRPDVALRASDDALPPSVDVAPRLSERFALPAAEASALVEAWCAPKLEAIRAVTVPGDERTPVVLGAFGTLLVRWHEVDARLQSFSGPSHHRFLFRPSDETTAVLGLTVEPS